MGERVRSFLEVPQGKQQFRSREGCTKSPRFYSPAAVTISGIKKPPLFSETQSKKQRDNDGLIIYTHTHTLTAFVLVLAIIVLKLSFRCGITKVILYILTKYQRRLSTCLPRHHGFQFIMDWPRLALMPWWPWVMLKVTLVPWVMVMNVTLAILSHVEQARLIWTPVWAICLVASKDWMLMIRVRSPMKRWPSIA